MPINFPPSAIKQINGAIQAGLGAASQVIGQPYNVYRNPTVITGQESDVRDAVLSASPVLTNFPASIKRTSSKALIENTTFDLLVYIATCDNRFLQLQDVMLEIGGDGGVYTFAQARPLRETLWIRTETNCSITRPFPEGGAAAQMPSSGAVFVPGYGGIPKGSEQVLSLVNGFYSFTSDPYVTPASVQCGLQPLNKVKDGNTLKTPTDNPRNHFVAYVPLLVGEQLDISDRLNATISGDRYEITQMFTTDMTGISGYILFVERLGT